MMEKVQASISPEEWLASQSKSPIVVDLSVKDGTQQNDSVQASISPEEWLAKQETTIPGVAGAVTRGVALPAAGALAGAALGAPIGGIGAVPGALAGYGAATLAQLAGDPITSTVNSIFGTHYTLPSDAMSDFLTRVGVPEARSSAEKIVEAIASGAAAAVGIPAAAKVISTAVGEAFPVTARVGAALAENPVAQAISGGAAGGASQGVAEAGGDPLTQLGAGLAAGIAAPGIASRAITKVSPSVKQTQNQSAKASNQLPEGEPLKQPIGQIQSGKLQTQEVPLSQLKLSKDVPQFKIGANESGVVEPLGGKYDRTGTGPIQVWRRENGDLEVISGRHRFDLAKRSGEETIPAQIHDESRGFDKSQAAVLDAELNIRDGQGKMKDYINYFKSADIDSKTAEEKGLLARSTGKKSFSVANTGSDELINAVYNDAISDDAAYLIGLNAPKDSALQSVGINAINNGKSIGTATNMMQAVKAIAKETDTSIDLLGFDEGALKKAESMARIASKKQREIQERLSAISGASKKSDIAKTEGIDINDVQALKNRVSELRQEKALWENWSSNADIVKNISAIVDSTDPKGLTKQMPAKRQKVKASGDSDKTQAVPAQQTVAATETTTTQKPKSTIVSGAESVTRRPPDLLEEAKKNKIDVFTSDMLPPKTWAGKRLKELSGKIPYLGTSQMMESQMRQRSEAVKRIANDFGAFSIDDVDRKIMDDLVARRGKEIKTYAGIKKLIIDKNSNEKIIPKNFISEIDNQINSLIDRKTDGANQAIDYLEKIKKQMTEDPRTLGQLEAFRADELSNVFKNDPASQYSAAARDVGDKAVRALYEPLRKDMGEHIRKNGGEKAYLRWRLANEKLSGISQDMQKQALQSVFRNGQSTPESVEKIIFSSKPSDVEAIYKRLSEKGRGYGRAAILQRAIKTTGQEEIASPEKFFSNMKKLGPQVDVFFKGDDRERVKGLLMVLNKTRGSTEAAFDPKTGAQAVPFIAGGALTSLFGGAGAIAAAGTIGTIARVYESPKVRDLLLKIAKSEEGSKYQALLFQSLNATIQNLKKNESEK